MSRTFSLNARGALYSEQSGEVCIFLVTVEHETLDDPLYFSSDPTARLSVDPLVYGTVSRGTTYNYLPMRITLPTDSEERAPTIRITMDNVMRDLVPLLRTVRTPLRISFEMVFSSALDTVEATWPEFDMVNVDYNAQSVTMDLVIDAMQTDPYPAGRFNPGAFGGLF